MSRTGKKRMPSTPRFLIATAAGLLLCASQASATLITLSDFASNGGGNAPSADVLDATMDFEVDFLLDTLTLTVRNTTVAPDQFKINRIYFNGGGNVTGLTMNAFPLGWAFEPDTHANGFGIFDFALGAEGLNLILPGAIFEKVFVFNIQFSGPYAKADFINAFSMEPPGDVAMTHAAKFVQGPGDASGFGARIPAPGSLLLLGIAGAFLTGRRRRRRQV